MRSGLWFGLAAAVFFASAIFSYNRLLDECKRRLPPFEMPSEFFYNAGKLWREISLYRKCCPEGRLHSVFLLSIFAAIIFFFIAIATK